MSTSQVKQPLGGGGGGDGGGPSCHSTTRTTRTTAVAGSDVGNLTTIVAGSTEDRCSTVAISISSRDDSSSDHSTGSRSGSSSPISSAEMTANPSSCSAVSATSSSSSPRSPRHGHRFKSSSSSSSPPVVMSARAGNGKDEELSARDAVLPANVAETLLFKSVLESTWKQARKLLQCRYKYRLAEYINSAGVSVLHAACSRRSTPNDIVRSLLALYPGGCLVRTKTGETPLHWVCDNGSDEAVFAVLETCRDAASAQDNYGQTPLHMACRKNRSHVVIQALLKANVSACLLRLRYDGRTPLHLASHVSSHKTVQLLCQACPTATTLLDSRGWTPLFTAVCVRRPRSVLRQLLKAGPTAIYITDHAGKCPLEDFLNQWKIVILQLTHNTLSNKAPATNNNYTATTHSSPNPTSNAPPIMGGNGGSPTTTTTTSAVSSTLSPTSSSSNQLSQEDIAAHIAEVGTLLLEASTRGTVEDTDDDDNDDDEYLDDYGITSETKKRSPSSLSTTSSSTATPTPTFLALHASITSSKCPWYFVLFLLRQFKYQIRLQDESSPSIRYSTTSSSNNNNNNKKKNNNITTVNDTKGGNLPLHLACMSDKPWTRPDEYVLNALYEAYPQALTVRNAEGYTPLHLALMRGRPTSMQTTPFTRMVTNDFGETTQSSTTTSATTTRSFDTDINPVLFLLSKDISQASLTDYKGNTPLHLLCQFTGASTSFPSCSSAAATGGGTTSTRPQATGMVVPYDHNVFDALYKAYPDASHTENHLGYTPLDIAVLRAAKASSSFSTSSSSSSNTSVTCTNDNSDDGLDCITLIFNLLVRDPTSILPMDSFGGYNNNKVHDDDDDDGNYCSHQRKRRRSSLFH